MTRAMTIRLRSLKNSPPPRAATAVRPEPASRRLRIGSWEDGVAAASLATVVVIVLLLIWGL